MNGLFVSKYEEREKLANVYIICFFDQQGLWENPNCYDIHIQAGDQQGLWKNVKCPWQRSILPHLYLIHVKICWANLVSQSSISKSFIYLY